MSVKLAKVRAETIPLEKIQLKDLFEMYALFSQYYDNVDFDTFARDLSKKKFVILVREKTSGRLGGFSTIIELPLALGKQKAIGVFSGDTVMHKDHWGSSSLQFAFFTHVLNLLLRNPHKRVFWLLISKGYKTYLLLANNWDNYYPRVDKPSQPEYEAIVEAYCDQLWPGMYDRKAKTLNFGTNSQRLKGDVTPITDQMRRNFPKIAFFEKCNPNWADGMELPCLGEAKITNAFTYANKFARRFLRIRQKQRA